MLNHTTADGVVFLLRPSASRSAPCRTPC